jgi:DNA-binding NtrC family response regulator
MKVLIVDDQPEVLMTVRDNLAEEIGVDGENYEVRAVQRHAEAVEIVKEQRFEVVVVDMTTASDPAQGLEVLSQLSAKSPVTIVLTAYPSIRNCVASMRLGAWDYLDKRPDDGSDPYDNLIESIRQGCVERSRHPQLGKPNPDAQWVKANLKPLQEDYAGHTIAVLDGKVIAVGETHSEVRKQLESEFLLVTPYIFIVPESEMEIVG